jgi:hypothetical protein
MRFNECETANERFLASGRRLASVPHIRATEYIGCSLWIEAAGDREGVYSMRDELAIKMRTPRQTTESTGALPNEESG